MGIFKRIQKEQWKILQVWIISRFVYYKFSIFFSLILYVYKTILSFFPFMTKPKFNNFVLDLCISNFKKTLLRYVIYIYSIWFFYQLVLCYFSFDRCCCTMVCSIEINFNSFIYCCTFSSWFRYYYFNVSSRSIFARSILT